MSKRLNHKYLLLVILSCTFFEIRAQDTIPLTEVIRQAMQHNFDVIVASGSAQIAVINNSKGEAGMFPQIRAGVFDNYSINDLRQRFANGQEITSPNAGGNQFGAFIQADWIVFDGLSMFHSKRILETLDEQAKLDLQLRMLETTRQVSNAYAELQRLNSLISFTSEIIGIAEERNKIEKLRWETGLVAKSNYLRSAVSLNQLLVSNINYKADYQKAIGNLNALIGVNQSMQWYPESIAKNNFEIENTLLAGVEGNGNIKRLLLQQELMSLEVKRAKARQLPTIALNGSYNFNRVDNTAGFSLLNRTYGPQAGIAINIPLFNAGSLMRSVKRSEVMLKQSEQLIQAERVRTSALLESNTSALKQIEDVIKLEQQTIEWSRELVEIEMERLKKGQTDVTALYQIQTDYENAAVRLSDAIYRRTLTQNEIKFIMGNVQ